MSTFESHKPTKRPRLHDEASTPSISPSNDHFNGARVKREQSPTPPPLQRRMVMSGTKRFAPFPPNCLPPNPGYKQNRRIWAKKCQSEMETLKLTTEKVLVRDDGVIVDWKSHVPVWSDNLQPGEVNDLAATITRAHQANAQQRPGVLHGTPPRSQSAVSTQVPGPDDNLPSLPVQCLPVPPRPRRKVACPPASSSPSAGGSASQAPSTPDPPTAETLASSKPLNELLTVEIVPGEEEKMSKMTMEYLERYFQMFDSDRASLASAYSSNASFSYREVKCFSLTPPSSLPPPDSIKRTRLDITATLLSLPPLQLLPSNGSEAPVNYDMMWLGVSVGMFVVCRGVHHGERDSSKRPVTHSFVFRQKEAYEEDARADGVWPLVAVAHQMIVFDSG